MTWSSRTAHSGRSAIIVLMENITPEVYIQVRSTNGISCAMSGVLAPIRATISARPVLNRNCSARIGTINSQDIPG